MCSIDFKDLIGLLVEIACNPFEPPIGCCHGELMIEAHRLRVKRGNNNIAEEHPADANELLVARRQQSLSEDRSSKPPY